MNRKISVFILKLKLNLLYSNQHEQSTSNETNSDYLNSFHTSVLLRETMINISKRLTKVKSLSLVDTHCHFDLIFDRYFFYFEIYLKKKTIFYIFLVFILNIII